MEVTTNTAIIWDGIFYFWNAQTDKDEPIVLPECWAVCPDCKGEGKTGNPAFNGVSLSNMDAGERDEFLHNLNSGVYDVTCGSCHGRTTVKGYNLSVLTPEQRKEYERQLDDHYAHLAEDRAERRATGCWY